MPGSSPQSTHYRGRFAPSPTGPLHFGSLLAAFGSWLLARHAGGEWWLRMEDLDPPREVPGAAEAQLTALTAFGLAADAPVTWQSQRSALYQAALDRLLASGRAFACRCSRSALAASGGIHHGCVAQSGRRDVSIRLRVPPETTVIVEDALQGQIRQEVWREVGDFVLKRADGLWAYQLAVVVDDAAQGMTDIVRGADLLESTPRQVLLQRALGLPTPRYLHLPLIVDADGHKLSKSSAALPVDAGDPLPALRAAWRALGQEIQALRGCEQPAALLAAAAAAFAPERLPPLPTLSLAALHNIADSNAD
jgi:glutamyl-Q tRNA(Asp) synthetase